MTPKRRAAIPLYDESSATLKSGPVRKRNPEQPSLAFDPMPDRVEPCLALLRPAPPEGPDCIFELKWDGYRLAIHIEPNGVRIITRGGHDRTHSFPQIAEAARKLGVGTAILDGEAVVVNGRDTPTSGRCSARSAGAAASERRPRRSSSPSTSFISLATISPIPSFPCAGICWRISSTAPPVRFSYRKRRTRRRRSSGERLFDGP